MDGSNRKRIARKTLEPKNPPGRQSSLRHQKRKRSSSIEPPLSDNSSSSLEEPPTKRARHNVARQSPVRRADNVEVIEIDDSDSDEDYSAPRIEAILSRTASVQKENIINDKKKEVVELTKTGNGLAEDSDTSVTADIEQDASPSFTDDDERDTSTSSAVDNDKENDTLIAYDKEKGNSFFQTHCWVCHVQLVSDQDQVCCYAVHTHPTLNTSVCSVCYEVMEDVIRGHTACAGCAEETETSFVCDNMIQGLLCQHEFCFECVEKAGLDVSKLQASKDEWHCLACNPTPTLEALCASDPSLPTMSERTTEDILQELDVAEDKKRECEEALEDVNVQRKYQEIYLELKETVPESELEEAVEEEIATWEELQMRHDARLGDFISKLQDELETRGLDMATVYHADEFLSMPTPSLPDVAPEWVQTAEKAIHERQKEEATLPVKRMLPSEEYKKDYSDDIVEIADVNKVPSFVRPKGSGWVNTEYTPTEDDDNYREARQQEDEERVRRKEKVSSRTETHDREAARKEGPRIRNRNGRMVVEHTGRRARSLPRTSAGSPSRTSKSVRPRLPQTASTTTPLSQDSEILSASDLDGPFIDSDVVLCTPSSPEASWYGLESEGVIRKVSIARGFANVLKEHQKEGVKFIWSNSFCDIEKNYKGDESDDRVGGCILAHHMGLGKTLTTITLLHTVLAHPSMVSPQTATAILRTVVLVVPVNTLANWEDEFRKWFVNVSPKVCVYTPSASMGVSAKITLIAKWMATGGIFLVSEKKLAHFAAVNGEETDLCNPVYENFQGAFKICDEATRFAFGSPFQNNLEEYFHICSFIREGVFGVLSQFKTNIMNPISQGQAKDATSRQKALTATLSADLRRLVDAHIHRRDLSILQQDLPKLSQVVIHVRPTDIQSKIYRTYEQARKSNAELRNFFKMYSELSPVHNHPSCLSMKYCTDNAALWCKKHLSSETEVSKLDKITASNKIVLLLHLLAYAEVLGEKVLIFSQCLPTLDYIEAVLQSEDWIKQVPSLACFSGQRLGGWMKRQHYLRIDGSNSSTQRGQSINAFNEDSADGDLRAFLISLEAGSLGINLTSASRVVLVDSHFNPTVTAQAVFRAYRYGQQKPEKIYARSVNKTGLALRLVDSKSIEGFFSAKELEDFQQFDSWVQCDKCEKWRMLTGESAEDLPDQWFCEMNSDHRNNSCDLPERDQAWYLNVYKNGFPASPQKQKADAEPEQTKYQLEDDDEMLSHLLSISGGKKCTSLVSRHYCHDSLLQSKHDSEEVENARILLANETDVKDLKSGETPLPNAGDQIETNSSFGSRLAAGTGVEVDDGEKLLVPSATDAATTGKNHSEDDHGKEPQVASVGDAIDCGSSLAPVPDDDSKLVAETALSSDETQNARDEANTVAEPPAENPARQPLLSSSPEIIDLCDSSDVDF